MDKTQEIGPFVLGGEKKNFSWLEKRGQFPMQKFPCVQSAIEVLDATNDLGTRHMQEICPKISTEYEIDEMKP